MKFIIFFVSSALSMAHAQYSLPWLVTDTEHIIYIALSPNINDFGRFADGGSDANWYIGYNNAWIVKLPAAPQGDYARAFIGAKVGRAKTRPNANKPWLREDLPGQVYMGISRTPSFTAEQSYFLAEAADLPKEPDREAYVDGTGASEWFWAEVPLSAVSFSGANYLVIWSPTKFFSAAAASPILAASAIDESLPRETRAWNNRSISGVPPRNATTALETPINNISPALAIKLVPAGSSEVTPTAMSVQQVGKKHIVRFSVLGENIAGGWLESSKDKLDWQRISKIQDKPPFVFTVPAERFPAPGEYLRAAARDDAGNTGGGDPYSVPYAPR